ncbi:MAG TPA: gamma-glutamyltransferase [Chloroflexota bacterium]
MTASWILGKGRPTARPAIMGTGGMASAGHPLAAQSAIRVLMKGGNVVDAAVAASAVLAVARPHMTGIGGDLFCLVYLAREGKVVAVNASGAAPQTATIDLFRQRGAHHVPMRGPLSVATPGCVAGWDLVLRRFGTMALGDLLEDAIAYAENGVPVSPHLAQAILEGSREPNVFPAWASAFTPGGKPPRVGERLKLPALARTLRSIQEGGADAFYRGPIAEEIDAFMQKEGGLLAKEDLAACEAEELAPVQVDYRGYTVYEQPPVSQGHLLLQELAIAEGFDLAALGPDSPEAIHLMVECKKLAFADRLRYMGDPAKVKVPLDELISKEYSSQRRKSIDPERAIIAAAPGAVAAQGRDTTHHCLMDAEGNCVTMIQSLFKSFGSGVVVGDTGITLNNRLANFFLDPAHPNSLAPGKRTIHTLNTFMMFREGRPFLVGGTPGADDQVQVNFQIVSDLVDHGMSLQEAIEAPRWSSTPGTLPSEIADPYELRMEQGFSEKVLEGLRQRGHNVKMVGARAFGSVSAVMMDPESGVLYGGSDPRRDGYAAGW